MGLNDHRTFFHGRYPATFDDMVAFVQEDARIAGEEELAQERAAKRIRSQADARRKTNSASLVNDTPFAALSETCLSYVFEEADKRGCTVAQPKVNGDIEYEGDYFSGQMNLLLPGRRTSNFLIFEKGGPFSRDSVVFRNRTDSEITVTPRVGVKFMLGKDGKLYPTEDPLEFSLDLDEKYNGIHMSPHTMRRLDRDGVYKMSRRQYPKGLGARLGYIERFYDFVAENGGIDAFVLLTPDILEFNQRLRDGDLKLR